LIGVLLPHGIAGKLAGLAGRRAEQRPIGVGGEAGGADVLVEILFKIVMIKTDVAVGKRLSNREIKRKFRISFEPS
jgi:hypothetical protein